MILPIVAYGDPVLNKVADEIDQDYPGLEALIKNMYETMYNAQGVGLAAPQIGRGIRLFVVDASPFAEEGQEDYELLKGFTKTFINPIIIEEDGEEWGMEEGCLSIPGAYEKVTRAAHVKVEAINRDGEPFEMEAEGLMAVALQHEIDHLDGKLMVDYISALKRDRVRSKLLKDYRR